LNKKAKRESLNWPLFGGECPPFTAKAALIFSWISDGASVGANTLTDAGQSGGFRSKPSTAIVNNISEDRIIRLATSYQEREERGRC
jgi:hypothetical protein